MITKLIEEDEQRYKKEAIIWIKKINELVGVVNRLEVDNAILKQKLDGGEDR